MPVISCSFWGQLNEMHESVSFFTQEIATQEKEKVNINFMEFSEKLPHI